MAEKYDWRYRARVSPEYRANRRRLLADGPVCVHCGLRSASVADHHPSLVDFISLEHWRSAGGVLVPSCRPCSDRQGGSFGRRRAPDPSRIW